MKPDNEQKQQQAATAASVQVSSQGKVASVPAIDRLKEFGGFSFLENIIDGYSNMNPNRKARRNIFLTDKQWDAERRALARCLGVWEKLIRKELTVEQMLEMAKETALQAEELLNKNLKAALARTHDLEQAYRSVAYFYKIQKVIRSRILQSLMPAWSSCVIWIIQSLLTILIRN